MAITIAAPVVLYQTNTSGDTVSSPEVLTQGSGINIQNAGATCTVSVASTSNAGALNAIDGSVSGNRGVLALTASNTLSPLTLQHDGTISITNPTGVGGNPSFAQVAKSAVQQTQMYTNPTPNAAAGSATIANWINFVPGNLIGITIQPSTLTGAGSGGYDVIIDSSTSPGTFPTGLTARDINITGVNPTTSYALNFTGSNQSIAMSASALSSPSVPTAGFLMAAIAAGPAGATGIPGFYVGNIDSAVPGWVPLISAQTQGPLGTGNGIPTGQNQMPISNGVGMFDLTPASTAASATQVLFLQTSTTSPFKAVWGATIPAAGLAAARPLTGTAGTPGVMSKNTSYIAIANGSNTRVVFTLPADAVVGDTIQITGLSIDGWRVQCVGTQGIVQGTVATNANANNRVESTLSTDNMTITCQIGGANSAWSVVSSQGNLSYT